MIALNIRNIPKLMSALLTGELFDAYTLREASITTFYTMTLDGRLERAFFSDGEEKAEETGAQERREAEYIRWRDARPRCLEMIRGKRIPLYFRFVFFLPKEEFPDFLRASELSADPSIISGLCLNLRFNGTTLVATTGTSLTVFTPDRTIDRAWDEYILHVFAQAGIEVEEAA